MVQVAQRLEDRGREGDVTQAEAAYDHRFSALDRLDHALRDSL